ncbi:DUF4156 domain-containing protein [Aliiglaciecola sp. CAU 1673]|uniref:DUF4156 domain-containing protein n=1 Tax=Aliiglaciecola sp. CAU 1673 TaxID=3032595 RepID=UPI0023DC2890|nr:DUF4156 domain-containing protein [Aliiglaciecola sp. CAU 1673]MDF2177119.1 DUF4156 domain-containing protein [Aliiglaciecola sp. CAU 1673]
MRTLLSTSAVILCLSACTSVERVPGSEYVRLLQPSETGHCEKVGKARTKVMEKVAFVERDDEKVADELLQLARNEAVRAGGNAVAIDGDVRYGSRQFMVYRCPQ